MSGIAATALTAFLYSGALALPFYSDDLIQLPWVENTTLSTLWSSPSPYGYYRPLPFTLWKAAEWLIGRPSPALHHLFNLLAHALAGWLVGLLADRWTRLPFATRLSGYRVMVEGGQPLVAGLAAALFVAFPFSRQVVIWASALSYPLVTALALGAVLAYDRARRRRAWPWLALSLTLAALAPFAHETGLLAPALVLLVEAVGRLHRRWSRPSWWPMVYLLLLGGECALWRTVRGAGIVAHGLTRADLWRNAGFLTQGLVFPTAPLSQLAVAALGLDSVLALWLAALPTLALLTWSTWRQGQRESLMLSLGWFAFTALPPLVTMKADWLADAPRFLHLPAVGAALLWAAALAGWSRRVPGCEGRLLKIVLLLTLTFGPATAFIRHGLALHRMAGQALWQAARTGTYADHPTLLVNLPARITPPGRTYPLGHEGVIPLPARVTARQLVYVHTGVWSAVEAVGFGVVVAPQPYEVQLFGRAVGWEELADAIRASDRIYLTHYQADRIELLDAGSEPRWPSPSSSPLARFGEGLLLLQAICKEERGGRVRLTARWQTTGAVSADLTVFAHLYAADGTLVAQADGDPLLGMYPFWLWSPGQAVREVRYFDGVTPGAYTVGVGVWNPTTGARLPAASNAGIPLPDDVVYLPACGP